MTPDPAGALSRDDRLALASLHGRAGYHVNHRTPHDEAVADLRDIATITPKTGTRQPKARAALRVDLLSIAAGQHLGAHRADHVTGWIGPPAAAFLIAAGGTDRELGEQAAAIVQERAGRALEP